MTQDSTLVNEPRVLIGGTMPENPSNYVQPGDPNAKASFIEGAVLRSSATNGKLAMALSLVMDGRLYADPPLGNIVN